MRYSDIYQFGGGHTPTSATSSEYALLINAASANAARQVKTPETIGQVSRPHDLTYRITAEQLAAAGGTGVAGNLLGTASIIVKPDSEGVPMIALSDPSETTMDGKWVIGNGGGTYGDRSPFSGSTPAQSFVGGGSPFHNNPTANHLIFMCVNLPASESWAAVKNVGFDIGGYDDDVNGFNGALCAYMGAKPTTFSQFGAVDVNDTGANWKGSYCAFTDITPSASSSGRVAFAVAVNGTGTGYGKRKIGGGAIVTATGGGSIGNTSVGTAWTSMAANAPAMVNLGDGVTEDFGIYCMGVRNYAAAISEFEVERVCAFMNRTGRLPYWWK